MVTLFVLTACGAVADDLRTQPTKTAEQLAEEARVVRCEKLLEEHPRELSFASNSRSDLIDVQSEMKMIVDVVMKEYPGECHNSILLIIKINRLDEDFFSELGLAVLDKMHIKISLKDDKEFDLVVKNSLVGVAEITIFNFVPIGDVQGIEVSFPDLKPYPVPTITSQPTQAGVLFWTIVVQGYTPFFGW